MEMLSHLHVIPLIAQTRLRFLFGFAVLWTWVRFMRRLPHLLSHHMAPRATEEHAAIAAAD